ncbi:major facilitator superfamily domain-containing protein [Lasiosphaeria miniovina]|uniref:Major facilitator superfamily domain-containing protein n=1 Tax=Lasiosphaeria miniovina TaxID=1954250 RepID=A0AA39ZQJ5_9PEZI|nr:major facilitator superfamily domain-containing protein [Lasiosphaeria miniovina]KAK0701580.1 major facilitator superfamily domain-containing protein [Lasiosphaeria miniovina]
MTTGEGVAIAPFALAENSDETTAEDSEKAEAGNSAPVSTSWDTDIKNPYNWPAGKKAWQVGMAASAAFLASMGTSIMTSSHSQLMQEFGVTSTAAIVPLSIYVFALALGPVVGGPLSETIGRYLVFLFCVPIGALFVVGAAVTHSFAALCILRFLAGFCFAPCLAISAGVLNETYKPEKRGLPSTLFILTPFLGPGLAPAIGSFVTNRKGWRWTQYTMLFFVAFTMLITIAFGRETYHPVLKRRLAKKLGQPVEPSPPLAKRARQFLTTALIRPIHMLFTEPIVGLVCLYASCEFATLFTFFAAVPYVFQGVYNFSIEDTGLVFLSIVTGCLLGTLTIIICDILLYRPQVPLHPAHMVPPEYRLYPAMIGSLGPPIGLFWFGWTARPEISWASPVVAMVPFAWGNLCIFISTMQYISDTYHGTTVASAASANSFARYGLAGAFPLFTIQMYSTLGIGWASSLLGFIALVLMPVPWVFFKFGKGIRARSKYETASY